MEKINFQDLPSTDTPIDSTNLNLLQANVENAINDLPQKIFPVGSIYISVTNTNPSSFLGGTWVSFGAGRVLVGVDTSQVEFNEVLKTGGSKATEKHTHRMDSYSFLKNEHANTGYIYTDDNQRFLMVGNKMDNAEAGINNNQARLWGHEISDGTVVTDSFGNGTSGNLQPYITVYFWRRTA